MTNVELAIYFLEVVGVGFPDFVGAVRCHPDVEVDHELRKLRAVDERNSRVYRANVVESLGRKGTGRDENTFPCALPV